MFDALPWFAQIFLLILYYSLRAFVVTGFFFFIARTFWGQNRKISEKPYKPQQIKFEIRQTLAIFLLDSLLLVGVVQAGLFKVNHLGLAQDVLSFLLLFVWVETLFYITHRLLHSRQLLPFHATHHKAKIPSPLSGFSFSMVERLILFFNTMSLLVLADLAGFSLSMTGMQAYFGFNVFMTVMGHSDLKLYPVSWRTTPVLQYLSDPSDHSLHHARYTANYGLFTNFYDKKFNTYRNPYIKEKTNLS